MRYSGIDAEYNFEIPSFILDPTMDGLSRKLGISVKRLKQWEDSELIPPRSRKLFEQGTIWTENEAREVFIKGIILMRRGTVSGR